MPSYGPVLGKGDAMCGGRCRRSRARLVCFLDCRHRGAFSGAFRQLVCSAPLVCEPGVSFVKAFYRRPLHAGGPPPAQRKRGAVSGGGERRGGGVGRGGGRRAPFNHLLARPGRWRSSIPSSPGSVSRSRVEVAARREAARGAAVRDRLRPWEIAMLIDAWRQRGGWRGSPRSISRSTAIGTSRWSALEPMARTVLATIRTAACSARGGSRASTASRCSSAPAAGEPGGGVERALHLCRPRRFTPARPRRLAAARRRGGRSRSRVCARCRHALRAGVEVVLMSGRRRAPGGRRTRGCSARSSLIFEAGALPWCWRARSTGLTGELLPGEVTIRRADRAQRRGAPALLLERYRGRLEYHEPWARGPRGPRTCSAASSTPFEVDSLLSEHGARRPAASSTTGSSAAARPAAGRPAARAPATTSCPQAPRRPAPSPSTGRRAATPARRPSPWGDSRRGPGLQPRRSRVFWLVAQRRSNATPSMREGDRRPRQRAW